MQQPGPSLQLSFFFDEHFNKKIVKALQSYGIDAESVESAGRKGFADPEQLAYAHRQGRVMFTSDNDYLILAQQGVPHSGIVYINPNRKKKISVGKIVRYLVFLWQTTSPEQIAGRVEFFFEMDN